MASETRTVGDFLKNLQQKPGCDFRILLQDWLAQSDHEGERTIFLSQKATPETLGAARSVLSALYGEYFQRICRGGSSRMCKRVADEHQRVIECFDVLALEWGFKIDEPVPVISGVKLAIDSGLVVENNAGGVILTPKCLQIAEEVRKAEKKAGGRPIRPGQVALGN